jgi:hypothetical protein
MYGCYSTTKGNQNVKSFAGWEKLSMPRVEARAYNIF